MGWPQPWDVQRAWVARVLGLIAPGGVVLDAPCGTGKYFAMLAAAGHRVAGADQSAVMLPRARARGIAFSLQRASLQDLSHVGRFDAVLTIEAMQHIPPEDWPGVLANLRRAVQPGGLVYLTVQDLHQLHIQRAFESLRARAARGAGELVEEDTPGYHYFPGRDQAVDWFGRQGLVIVDEGFSRETAGPITTSCCAPARRCQHHDTVPYREALVSWLLRERLGQGDQNDPIWMPRLVIPEVPPTVQIRRLLALCRGEGQLHSVRTSLAPLQHSGAPVRRSPMVSDGA